MERPIVTEEEFEWMKQCLKENQQQAEKNTKRRTYLLKGMVRCTACGAMYTGVTVTRRGKTYSWYVCSARSKRKYDGEKCQSKSLKVDALEEAVFGMVVEFLHSPEGFGGELQRRRGITEESEASLLRDLKPLERQQKEEQEAEARAFRLASRGQVSEEVFSQEVGLIRTRQRWLAEQREGLEQQLEDIRRYSFDPENVARLRHRLAARLASATPEDRQFILKSLSARVLAQTDGTWELELQVPREAPAPAGELQIVNSRPGSVYTVNTEIQCLWRPRTSAPAFLVSRKSRRPESRLAAGNARE